MVRLFLLFLSTIGGLSGTSALAGHWLAIVCLVPLLEWRSIDINDSALHKGVGADKFVVRCIVNNRDNPCLFRNGFRAPRKVAGFETESTEFEVTTTGTDGVNALRTELGVGGLATEFELPLLAVVGALGTSFGAFVS